MRSNLDNNVAVLLLILLFALSQTFTVVIKETKAEPNSPVHNLDTSRDYASLQEAIDSPDTLEGHAILVDPGILREHVTIHKSLKIMGGDPTSTIIDGDGSGTVVRINADEVWFSGFTVRGGGSGWLDCGVFLNYSSSCNVSHNIVTECRYGIYVFHSRRNVLSFNNVSGNSEDGVWLYYAGQNTLAGNRIWDNRFNFGVFGGAFIHFNNTIDQSNNVDGKPILYLVDVKNLILDAQADMGALYLINSHNLTIKNLNLTGNGHGLFCWNATGSRIENLTVSSNNYGIHLQNSFGNLIIENHCPSNWVGVFLHDSERNTLESNVTPENEKGISLYEADNNTLTRNTVSQNLYGIRLYASSFNRVVLSNIIDNVNQVDLVNSYQNSWDDGLEGNFWSDYAGSDVNGDGVGDAPYNIGASNEDHYPLVGKIYSLNPKPESQRDRVTISSNRTISSLNFNLETREIRLLVEHDSETHGFCRASIPHTLMDPEAIHITTRGEHGEIMSQNHTLLDNGTHRWIYFTYKGSNLEIAISENYPPTILLPIAIFATALAAIALTFTIMKRKTTEKMDYRVETA